MPIKISLQFIIVLQIPIILQSLKYIEGTEPLFFGSSRASFDSWSL